MNRWRVDKQEWLGQQCFIMGGGASVLSQDLTLLHGQKVIGINSAYETYPQCDFIIFADTRWLDNQKAKHRERLLAFKGRIVSASTGAKGPPLLLNMHRKLQPGLAEDKGTVSVKNTTFTAAINLAVHLGVSRIVLLGLDGKATNGKTHHHTPHPWKVIPGCWEKQRQDLAKAAEDLVVKNIECVNASPGSVVDIWPIVELKDYACPVKLCA